MKTICIDPGSIKSGWAILSNGAIWDSCMIKVAAKKPIHERLNLIHQEFTGLLEEYSIQAMLIEIPGFNYRVKAGKGGFNAQKSIYTLSRAVGVIQLAGVQAGLEMHEIEAHKWMMGMKDKMRMIVAEQTIGRKPVSQDEADAICISNWWKVRGNEERV